MIKLEKVNKYFYHHKKNEIHVINNTTLDFDSHGLVSLLGPSGCGKTTLLNAIGGLDKVNNGNIYVDGKRITKKCTNKVDEIRNLNIGYIFQDYNLIDNMTVFDNVALVLKMIGLKDKEEIKARVNYVLETIGIYRYRNRLAGMLSGGERQRVGIARAIVKDPKIIIADEPTGNLDSKNTIEIMNIIKSISKKKLVILVTHEKELAYFYSSRIIELKDGSVISDKKNNHNDELDYRMENKIYLKDIEKHEEIKDKEYNINYYNDTKEKLDIDIVVKNGNIYIKTNKNEKIEVIDNNSSIELINDKYKKITQEESEKYDFHLEKFINEKNKYKYTSIFNPVSLIINGFRKVFQYSFLKKMLLIGFFISAMFILYSISNIAGVLDVKDEDFITQNKNYLTIISKKVKVNDYLAYEKEKSVNYLLPGNSIINLTLKYEDYYQTSRVTDTISGSIASIEMLKEKDLICGNISQNKKEIVVDEMVLDKLMRSGYAKNAGLVNKCDFIGREVSTKNIKDIKIVGVSKLSSPSIYVDRSMMLTIISDIDQMQEETMIGDNVSFGNEPLNYELKKGQVSLKKGRWPTRDYEVVVNYNQRNSMKLNKKISLKVNGVKLKVVGYYTDKYSSDYYLVSPNTIKYDLISKNSNIIIYANDKEEAIELFQNKKLNIEDTYTKNKKDYIKRQRENTSIALVIAGVILAVSFVEIFLMVRSSFLSRIKEVGIYRAIGVKKTDIYKMFLGEILAITTIGSGLGYLFMWYVITKLLEVNYLKELYLLNAGVLIFSIVLIYLFNIVIGLLPVFTTIRKTPAAILSRTDVD